jgi:hypothetical protein
MPTERGESTGVVVGAGSSILGPWFPRGAARLLVPRGALGYGLAGSKAGGTPGSISSSSDGSFSPVRVAGSFGLCSGWWSLLPPGVLARSCVGPFSTCSSCCCIATPWPVSQQSHRAPSRCGARLVPKTGDVSSKYRRERWADARPRTGCSCSCPATARSIAPGILGALASRRSGRSVPSGPGTGLQRLASGREARAL